MIGALLLCALAWGRVEVNPPPRVGEESVILLLDAEGTPRPGQTVRVVYRPGLHHEEEQAVGITDGKGRVRWTPSQGGVTRVRADDEQLELAVGWATPPPGTLVLLSLLTLAGLLGLGYGLWPSRR